jgi:hypothetical protein
VNGFYGQLWWLIKDTTMTIDAVIQKWRKGGADKKVIKHDDRQLQIMSPPCPTCPLAGSSSWSEGQRRGTVDFEPDRK